MLSRRILFFCSIVPLTAAVLAGCSDPYAGRMEITGRVKLEGQPLKDGLITFVPLEQQGTQGGSGIENGDYRIPRQNGLKPGKYLVQITSGDGKTPANEEEAGGPSASNTVSFDRIPEDWNTKSDKKVDVNSSGANRFDFEIPKANTPKPKTPKKK